MKTALAMLLAVACAYAQVPARVLRVNVAKTGTGGTYRVTMTNATNRPITCIILGFPNGQHFWLGLEEQPLLEGASMNEETALQPSVSAVILDDGRVAGQAWNADGSDFLTEVFAGRQAAAQEWAKWRHIADVSLGNFLQAASAPPVARSVRPGAAEVARRTVDGWARDRAGWIRAKLGSGGNPAAEEADLRRSLADLAGRAALGARGGAQ